MTRRIDRRAALSAIGTVSLGALFAACGDDDPSVSPQATTDRFSDSSCDPFLRGVQVTNRDGIAELTTIYPGWYRGRTLHIHATALTTQVLFDDAVSDDVFARDPYAGHGDRDVGNDADGIFDSALLLDLARDGDAYAGSITFDVAAS